MNYSPSPGSWKWAVLGLILGASAALWLQAHPGWASENWKSLVVGALGTTAALGWLIDRRMTRAVADHEQRAEAFRIAMLAQYAPHLLDGAPDAQIARRFQTPAAG